MGGKVIDLSLVFEGFLSIRPKMPNPVGEIFRVNSQRDFGGDVPRAIDSLSEHAGRYLVVAEDGTVYARLLDTCMSPF